MPRGLGYCPRIGLHLLLRTRALALALLLQEVLLGRVRDVRRSDDRGAWNALGGHATRGRNAVGRKHRALRRKLHAATDPTARRKRRLKRSTAASATIVPISIAVKSEVEMVAETRTLEELRLATGKAEVSFEGALAVQQHRIMRGEEARRSERDVLARA